MKVCAKCSTENRDGARFCQVCGASLETVPAEPGEVQAVEMPTQVQLQPETATAPPPVSVPSQVPKAPVVSAATDATQPLEPPPPEFAALPEGALVGKGRYEIVSILSEGEELNAYLVRGLQPVVKCPNPECGFENNAPDDDFCSNCGVALEGVSISHPEFLLKEAAEEETFGAESEIARLRLSHPGLIVPQDTFQECPYGESQRVYLIQPLLDMGQAESLPVPQETERVLSWGMDLARALSYLHQNHVAHQVVDLQHILIDEAEARLADFGASYVVPPAARGEVAQRRYQEDIRMLAQSLYYLLTGESSVSPEASLSPSVTEVFNSALALAPEEGYPSAEAFATDLERLLQELQRPVSINLRTGRLTHPGQVRELNEDSLLTVEVAQVCESVSQPMGLYVVADGMGGHEGGEVASRMTVEVLAERMVSEVLSSRAQATQEEETDSEEWLKTAFQQANKAVYDERMASGNDMGTTLVASLVIGDVAYLANAGDSRAYLVNSDGIYQITTDHSMVERLVAVGRITPEEAKVHPQRNVIYRTVGDKPQLEVDTFEQRLNAGDRLLLCSDGLSGMVEDEDIQRIVMTSLDPQEACSRLIQAANDNGGEDNVTVVMVQVEAA